MTGGRDVGNYTVMILIKYSKDESRMELTRHVSSMGKCKMLTIVRGKDVTGRDHFGD
jgi:hypothetical protein